VLGVARQGNKVDGKILRNEDTYHINNQGPSTPVPHKQEELAPLEHHERQTVAADPTALERVAKWDAVFRQFNQSISLGKRVLVAGGKTTQV